MSRLILHIGLEKTGSTSFQAFCAERRADLGALYPVNPLCFAHDQHAPLAASYFSAADAARLQIAGRRADRAEAVAALKAECAGAATALVSAEHFSSRFDPGRIAALADDLAGFDVTVAAVVRHPLPRARSAYATTVASGRALTLDAFVDELCQPGNAYLRARDTLAPWAQVFGRERMAVVGYREGGEIVSALAQRLLPGAPVGGPYRRNVSPPAPEIERRRRANALGLGGWARRLFVGRAPAALSPAQTRRIEAFVAEDLAWLQAEYGVTLQSGWELQ